MRRSRKERALVEQAARQLTVDPADKSGQGGCGNRRRGRGTVSFPAFAGRIR